MLYGMVDVDGLGMVECIEVLCLGDDGCFKVGCMICGDLIVIIVLCIEELFEMV